MRLLKFLCSDIPPCGMNIYPETVRWLVISNPRSLRVRNLVRWRNRDFPSDPEGPRGSSPANGVRSPLVEMTAHVLRHPAAWDEYLEIDS